MTPGVRRAEAAAARSTKLPAVYRRAYALLVGVAGLMVVLALVAAAALDKRLIDPDGFLGPSWLRLPLLCLAALFVDLVPRGLWLSKGRPQAFVTVVKERWHEHWNRERMTLVMLGIVCFYLTYVCYRNLKSFLPLILGDANYDRPLDLLDHAIFFGHTPAGVIHSIFGTHYAAHILSSIYMLFIPMVAVFVAIWCVWSRNISYGYWFVTSQCLIWTLGTATYYMLPSLGPGFEYPARYLDLSHTATTDLMNSLYNSREAALWWAGYDGPQTVAAFASLHTGVSLLWALMAQYTIKIRWVHWVLWTNFGLTVIATLYFGWHYVADDVAGVAIAVISFYLGGLASGQKFDRHGLASHPTTTTSKVPIEVDD